MSVLAVGLSHRSSPVALLERVAMAEEERDTFLTELTGLPSVGAAMLLSTCNRLEIYADVETFHGGASEVTELLCKRTGVENEELGPHLYTHFEERAAQHLFAVACGLDSMVVGEGQILGQVRQALKTAQRLGTLGRLGDVGRRALRAGKRAHTETHIDQAGADMVSAGLLLAGRHLMPPHGEHADGTAAARPPEPTACPAHASTDALGEELAAAVPEPWPLTGRRVLVLGAGSMSALAANTVARQGAGAVLVANRTWGRAARLAECLTEAYDHVDSRAVEFDEAAAHLPGVDLVVCCTGAQGQVIGAHDVAPAAARRSGRPLVFLDLALPHDVDPGVRDLPGTALVDLEDMRRSTGGAGERADASLPQAADITAVRDIVAEELDEYRSQRRAELVAPTVVALRSQAAGVVEAELDRLHGRLPHLDERAKDEVAQAMRRVADKLLHQPTVRVKELASAPGGDAYETALRELFGLSSFEPVVSAADPAAGEE